MTTQTRWTTGLAVLTGCLAVTVGLAADAGKGVLPPKQVEIMLKADAALIAETITDKKLTAKSAAKKAQAAAIMIAAYAQDGIRSGSGDVKKLAGLRDEALALAKKIYDEGSPSPAKDAKLSIDAAKGGDPKPKKLVEPELVDVVMKMFSSSDKTGGLRIEKSLRDLTRKTSLAKSDFEELTPLAYKVAMIGVVTEELAPPAAGKKKPEDWVKWSKDMTDAALKVGEAATKGDEKMAKAGLRELENSCVNCHNIFRD
jgi:hypothetical protein